MTSFRFDAATGPSIAGSAVYSYSEHSFRFEAESGDAVRDLVGEQGPASISIGTLQIEVAIESGLALFAWGYHPAFGWIRGSAQPRTARPGLVHVVADQGFVMGGATGLADAGEWVTILDDSTGWVHVTPDPRIDDDEVILVATGTGLGLVGSQLNSVWLQPRFEP